MLDAQRAVQNFDFYIIEAKFILEEAPVTLVIGYCCDFMTNSELP